MLFLIYFRLIFFSLFMQQIKCQMDQSLNVTDQRYYSREQTRLEKDLFKNYSRLNRPVKDRMFKTTVQFYALVKHVNKMNENEGTITVTGSLYLEWIDYFLAWEKENYNNVSRLVIHAYQVWRPNLLVYNGAEKVNETTLQLFNSHVWLFSSGRVIWYPTFRFVATCDMDFSSFPYDIQECPIILGPWSYTTAEIEFELMTSSPDTWMTFNETKTVVSGWEINNITQRLAWWMGMNQSFTYTKPVPSEDMFFYFPVVQLIPKMVRHLPYFSVTTLLPAVATATLTMCSFFMDDFLLRTGLLGANFVVQIIFSEDILRILPLTTDGIPGIVIFLSCNLYLTLASLILYVVFENLKRRKTSEYPLPVPLSVASAKWTNLKTSVKSRLGLTPAKPFVSDDQQEPENVEVPNNENQATVSKVKQTFGETAWVNAVDMLNEISFFIFLIIYSILINVCIN